MLAKISRILQINERKLSTQCACGLGTGRKFGSAVLLASAFIFLGGCASIEEIRPDIAAKPIPSRLDEIAYINELRSAYVVTESESSFPKDICFKGNGLKPFKSKSGQGYRPDPDPEDAGDGCIRFRQVPAGPAGAKEVQDYLAAGFGLTDLYCERFFTTAAASDRNRKFGRTVSNGVDTLIGSVLTLSGAGRTAIGITNAGFGLIDNGFEAYDTAYLVGPDLSVVRRLVSAAQSEYRQGFLKADEKDVPKSYAGARSVIERYAGLCSYTGMRELVGKSVSDKTNEINEKVAKEKKDDKTKDTDGAVGSASQSSGKSKGTKQNLSPPPQGSSAPQSETVPPPPA